jgi:hypothetical protein
MKKALKIGCFGFLTWLVPFGISLMFYTRDGQPMMDIFLIKSIMIVLFSAFGAFLLIVYFRKIDSNFVREGLIIGGFWFSINCILDILLLLPFAGMTMATWFAQIGVRYLLIPIMSISMGYIANHHKLSMN